MKQKVILIALSLTLAWAVPPRASAQWVQTNGPYGGIVTSLFSAGSNLFAETERERKLFHSTDSGAGWSVASAVLTDAGVTCFAAIATTLFAGTNDSGVFLSNDNGTTWNAADSGIPPQTGVSALAFVGTTLFAGTTNGAFFSNNNGTSWTAVDSGLGGNTISSFAMIDTNGPSPMLFAGTYGSGVFLLTNDGTIWTSMSTGLSNFIINAMVASGTNLVVEAGSGICISTNQGTSWTSANPSLPISSDVTAIGAIGTNIFAGTNGSGLFLSTDNGTSWAVAGFTNTPIFALATIGTDLFAGTYNGVFLSTDSGVSWISERTGMINTAITAFAEFGENGSPPMLIAGTYDGGVFLTTDDGITWSMSDSSMVNINFEAMLAVGSSLFAGTLEGVFLSKDSGVSWQPVNGGLPDSSSVDFFAFIGTDLFAVTSEGVYRSTDTGANWTIADSGLANANIRVITASGTNASSPMLVAGGYHGIFLSSDGGLSWSADSETSDLNIFSMTTFNNQSPSPWLFAGTADGMFLSTDQGITWAPSGLEGEFINTILTNGTNLFAGTFYNGIFLSTDSGKSWEGVSEGLADSNITSLAVDSTNVSSRMLFAGINGSGVWRRPLYEMIASYAVESTLSVEETISAYPNPFSISTTISLSIPESGVAEVTIVNLLGEEVAHLFEGELAAGTHSLQWNSNGAAPGMYECVANINGAVERTSMILLR